MARRSLSLIERWQVHRDPDALREVIRQYSGMVHAVSRRILRNGSEAEDVAQECFIALAQSSSVRADAVGAWLHAVATRRSLHRLRTHVRRQNRETEFASQSPSAVRDIAQDELYRHIDEAIDELPDDLKTPLVAHYFEGQSHASIARALGVPRRTLSHRIARAVQHVGNTLKRRGVAASSVALGLALNQFRADAATLARSWELSEILPFDDAPAGSPRTSNAPAPHASSPPDSGAGLEAVATEPPWRRVAVRGAVAAGLVVGLPLGALLLQQSRQSTMPADTVGALTSEDVADADSPPPRHDGSRQAAPLGGGTGASGGVSGGGTGATDTLPGNPDYVVPDYSRYAMPARVESETPPPVNPQVRRVGDEYVSGQQRHVPRQALRRVDVPRTSTNGGNGSSAPGRASAGYIGPGGVPDISNYFFTIDDRAVGETPPAG